MSITIQTKRPGEPAVIVHEYRTGPRNLVQAIHLLRRRHGDASAGASWLEVDHQRISSADMEFVLSRTLAGMPLQKARDLLALVRNQERPETPHSD